MEKVILYALMLVWSGFTMYWAYTQSMKQENSWQVWKVAYILSVLFVGMAAYLQPHLLWGFLAFIALLVGEVFAWLSQGPHYPVISAIIARRLGEVAAFATLLWIVIN